MRSLTGKIIKIILKAITVVVYISTLIASFSGNVNPEHWVLPAMFVLMLPWLTLLTVILIICWAIGRNWIISAAGVVVIILGIGSISTAVPIGFPKKPIEGEKTFTLMTYNITHGIDIRKSREEIKKDTTGNRAIRWLIKQDVDIVCLEELYEFHKNEIPGLTPALLDSLKKAYPYQAYRHWTDRTLLSKYPVEIDYSVDINRPLDKYIDIYIVTIDGRKLWLAVCHLRSFSLTEKEQKVMREMANPQSTRNSVEELKTTIRSKIGIGFRERAESVSDIRTLFENLPGPLIVCGDFNDVPASWTYRVMLGDDMRDAFKETGFGPTPTFNKHLLFFRLDHILYRGPIEALNIRRDKFDNSDHYPLIATFAFTNK